MTPLRQRLLEDMQMRNFSPHTQRAYIRAVAPSRGTSAGLLINSQREHVRQYLLTLIERKVAWSANTFDNSGKGVGTARSLSPMRARSDDHHRVPRAVGTGRGGGRDGGSVPAKYVLRCTGLPSRTNAINALGGRTGKVRTAPGITRQNPSEYE